MRPLMVRIFCFGLSVLFAMRSDARMPQHSLEEIRDSTASLHARLTATQDPTERMIILFSLAEMYQSVNDDSLKVYVDQLLATLEADTSLTRKVQVWKWAAELSFKEKDYETALEHRLTYYEYADSLQDIKHRIALDSLALALTYEAERDSIALQLASVELRKEGQLTTQRSAIQVGVVLFFALLAVLSMLYFANKLRNESNVKLALLNNHLDDQNVRLKVLNRTKTRFFSIIAHDIRGPMSTFTGFYKLLEKHINKKYQEKEGFRSLSLKVNKSASQITHLLDTLLDWALKEEGALPHHPVWVDVATCVEENVGLFTDQAALKSIRLVTELEDGLKVFVDKDAMLTILRNLLVNALKFTPEGGEVVISAWKEEETIHISVKDTGVGMSDAQLDQLFNETDFTSTRGTKGEKGTGLGMSLVTEFVKMNNGKIEVTSQLNEGTTFLISFPEDLKETE